MDEEETVDDHFVGLNAFIRQHSYGMQTIKIANAHSPEAKYRARISEQKDIDVLAESFLRFQTVHTNSVFVAFWPNNKQFPAKVRFDISDTKVYAQLATDGFFFIAGDHTQSAIKEIHTRYPKNKKWQEVTGTLLICRRDPRTLQTLKSWGILDNIKGQKRTTVSFCNKITSIHEDFEQIRANISPGDPSYKDLISEVKKARMRDYDMSSNSFGQLWNLAAREGGVWKAINAILLGRVANPKKFKLPRSCSAFTGMGNIPSADLEFLLNEVVKGHATLAKFGKMCKRYKAKARVQTQILAILEADSWEASQLKYPNTCSSNLVDMWSNHIVSSLMKQKTEMPASFFEMIEQRLSMDKEINKSKEVIAGVSAQIFLPPSFININEIGVCHVLDPGVRAQNDLVNGWHECSHVSSQRFDAGTTSAGAAQLLR